MGQCLKCGKQTEDRAVFCDACLAVMEHYPVKPGTVAHILHRPARAENDILDNFDQHGQTQLISRQRRIILWLMAIIVILSVLLAISATFLLRPPVEAPPLPTIGKNYTTDTSNKAP